MAIIERQPYKQKLSKGELSFVGKSTNKKNHLENLKIFSGRWRGTVYKHGIARVVQFKQ